MRFNLSKHLIIRLSILCIILVLAFSLRLWGIGSEPYWVDEEFSVTHSSLTFGEIIANAGIDTHPPLYYIILHFWMNVFGDSEIYTRLLSSIFGILAVFMMYLLGKLLFNSEVGIISSFILALSTFHIAHSQEARMYPLMVILTLISMYFFVKLIKEMKEGKEIGKEKSEVKKEGRGAFWSAFFTNSTIYYTLSSILLLYTHIYGVFIIIAQNLFIILIAILSRSQKGKLITKIIHLKKWSAIQILIFVLSGFMWNKSKGTLRNISAKIFSNVESDSNSLWILLVLWLLVPILLPFLISIFGFPLYSPKYTL